MNRSDRRGAVEFWLIGGGVLLVIILIICFLGMVVVSPGTVGVQVRLGVAFEKELGPGFYIINPFLDSVVVVDTKLRSYQVDQADSSSHDLQKIFTDVSIQHSLDETLVSETYMAIGDMDKIDANVIKQAVEESMKAVTAKYTAEELIKDRASVKEEMTNAIKTYIEHTLHDKDARIAKAVRVANVALTNFAFSQEFNHAIEMKVKAEQDALREENDKKKRITSAEALAKEKTLAADSLAYSVEVESVARAEAIKREAEALAQNPHLIKLRAIEKWNGVLPTFHGGASPVPFIEIPVGGK